jgi:hypothetical protein
MGGQVERGDGQRSLTVVALLRSEGWDGSRKYRLKIFCAKSNLIER